MTRNLLQLQFGAGVHGPNIEVVQLDLASPPKFRVNKAYEYPASYKRKVLPHDETTNELDSKSIASTTKYEVIVLKNESEHRISRLLLRIRLDHDSAAEQFEHAHPEPLLANQSVQIALWPVQYMPNYQLSVAGNYVDDVGRFPLKECKVIRP
jgi:hypothetical protein